MRRPARLPGLPPLLVLAALLLLWEVAARALDVGGLPPARAALEELPLLLGDREVVGKMLASLRRMAVGFALAFLVAVPLGLLIGRSRIAEALATPLLMIIYPVPKAALMPLVMLWLGVGDASKILVIFLGVSIPVLFHAAQGGRSVPEKLIWSAAAMGMGRMRRLLLVTLPAALPEILVGCRTGLVLALVTMVTSEMIARQAGVGDVLFNALDMGVYEAVYGTILIIAALGCLLDIAFEALRRRLVGWADSRDPLLVGSA